MITGKEYYERREHFLRIVQGIGIDIHNNVIQTRPTSDSILSLLDQAKWVDVFRALRNSEVDEVFSLTFAYPEYPLLEPPSRRFQERFSNQEHRFAAGSGQRTLPIAPVRAAKTVEVFHPNILYGKNWDDLLLQGKVSFALNEREGCKVGDEVDGETLPYESTPYRKIIFGRQMIKMII
jgi:hypothetical protein